MQTLCRVISKPVQYALNLLLKTPGVVNRQGRSVDLKHQIYHPVRHGKLLLVDLLLPIHALLRDVCSQLILVKPPGTLC